MKATEENWAKEICAMELYGKRIAVAQKKKLGEALCREKADIIIAQDVKLPDGCAGAAHVFDLRALDKTGAVGMYLTGATVEIHTAAERRGMRPWVAIPYETRYAAGTHPPEEKDAGK